MELESSALAMEILEMAGPIHRNVRTADTNQRAWVESLGRIGQETFCNWQQKTAIISEVVLLLH
jgi:hypothetical protein